MGTYSLFRLYHALHWKFSLFSNLPILWCQNASCFPTNHHHSLVITRKLFEFILLVTGLLQAKSNGIINRFELIGSLVDLMSNIRINIDKYYDEWYSEVCKLAQEINFNEPVLGKLQGKISLLNHHLIITNYPYQFHWLILF